jgi:hypothetical protein
MGQVSAAQPASQSSTTSTPPLERRLSDFIRPIVNGNTITVNGQQLTLSSSGKTVISALHNEFLNGSNYKNPLPTVKLEDVAKKLVDRINAQSASSGNTTQLQPLTDADKKALSHMLSILGNKVEGTVDTLTKGLASVTNTQPTGQLQASSAAYNQLVQGLQSMGFEPGKPLSAAAFENGQVTPAHMLIKGILTGVLAKGDKFNKEDLNALVEKPDYLLAMAKQPDGNYWLRQMTKDERSNFENVLKNGVLNATGKENPGLVKLIMDFVDRENNKVPAEFKKPEPIEIETKTGERITWNLDSRLIAEAALNSDSQVGASIRQTIPLGDDDSRFSLTYGALFGGATNNNGPVQATGQVNYRMTQPGQPVSVTAFIGASLGYGPTKTKQEISELFIDGQLAAQQRGEVRTSNGISGSPFAGIEVALNKDNPEKFQAYLRAWQDLSKFSYQAGASVPLNRSGNFRARVDGGNDIGGGNGVSGGVEFRF